MAPNAAMQMALANLLRGGLPQRMASGMGPPPIDSSLPGLPGMDGMAPQMAIADALSGRAGAAPEAPPVETQEAAAAPTGEAAQGDMLGGVDLSSLLSGDFERQRERTSAIARQRAVGNLGLLTGDRVLSNFGQAQLSQAQSSDPNTLRYLDLLQKQQRLAQQEASEARQGRQGDARLGLAERQYNTQAALGWGALGQRKQEHVDEVEENRRRAERQRLKDIQDTQDRLRGELTGNKIIKDAQEAEANFLKVEEIAKNPNPANDIALIFSVMKTYDPSSTVREGEFASAQNAANVPDRIRNAFNRAKEGTILNPKQRREFVESARTYLNAQKRKASEIAAGYEKTARESGVDPRFVIPEGTISGYSVRAGPPRTTPGALPKDADGNPTLDTPAPAAGAASQDDLPPLVSTRGMKPGDLAKSVEEGKRIRIRAPGGGFTTFEKRNGKLFKVSGN